MDIDANFFAGRDQLIDEVFPTSVTYHQHVDTTGSYDPATGTIPLIRSTTASSWCFES